MKASALAVLAVMLLAATQASAQLVRQVRHDTRSPHSVDADLGPRHTARGARAAITTRDDMASLFLTDRVVAVQLTDRAIARIARDHDDGGEGGEGGAFARAISHVVVSGVQKMLRRSLEIPVAEIRSVDYREGRLVFTSVDGETILQDVEIDDTDMMAAFRPADARAFVRSFRAVKARAR